MREVVPFIVSGLGSSCRRPGRDLHPSETSITPLGPDAQPMGGPAAIAAGQHRVNFEDLMADASSLNPSREDFAALLEQSFSSAGIAEGSVVKGKVVQLENDFAIIDVGLKMEGRVQLREFLQPDREGRLEVGDEVEVYLERIENAMGEAVLSREKARREEAWTRLEESHAKNQRVDGVIFGRVRGGFDVDVGGAVAFLPGSQVDVRPILDLGSLLNFTLMFQILKLDRRRVSIV